ncbi:unnamed protein product [Effrenium voratum]|uniref:Uncharacterized protein n=1 Tax=Effrenium voratum TaxID=2562239 RepID=A0AA36IYA1_9DINO|nr:unnamed protein product [Effrenium voratum]CAJ1395101.1 unnamed protein product [Effrenium voratum]
MQQLAHRGGLSEETMQDLKWYVFNVCWMTVNLRWYGASSTDHHEASNRASHHFRQLGGAERVILGRRPVSKGCSAFWQSNFACIVASFACS